jgi:hypothetical protein
MVVGEFSPIGEILDSSEPRELETDQTRKRFLLILSARILDSRVERGIPSRAAAPDGPNTHPPLARKASSTIAFSRADKAPDNVAPRSMAVPVQIERPLVHAPNRLARLSRVPIDEVLDQHGNVLSSVPQRRNLERKHVQPIKEILPEGAAVHRRAQVAIRRGDDAHVDLNRLSAPDSLELPLLQHPQQRDLGLCR